MLFEKMFSKKEQSVNNHESANAQLERSGSFDKAAKIAAVIAMFLLPTGLKAQESPADNQESGKQKIEDTRVNLNKVASFIWNKVQSEQNFINRIEVKDQSFINGSKMTVAENNKFVVVSENEGKKAYYDDNADGLLDRVVINNKEYQADKLQSSADLRNLDNNFYFFDSRDNLKKSAEVTAQVKPEAITTVILNHESNIITMIDSGDGTTGVSTAEQGKKVIESLQGKYAAQLEAFAKEIDKN